MSLDPRTWRALVALVFGHRERAIILDALGVGGAGEWREEATLEALVERARHAEGGLELVVSLLRSELLGAEARTSASAAAMATAWDAARRSSARAAASLLLAVATSEGVCMRRLEQRMLDELEVRAWEALRRPPRHRAALAARGVVHP